MIQLFRRRAEACTCRLKMQITRFRSSRRLSDRISSFPIGISRITALSAANAGIVDDNIVAAHFIERWEM
jgi:hypothetical protein